MLVTYLTTCGFALCFPLLALACFSPGPIFLLILVFFLLLLGVFAYLEKLSLCYDLCCKYIFPMRSFLDFVYSDFRHTEFLVERTLKYSVMPSVNCVCERDYFCSISFEDI